MTSHRLRIDRSRVAWRTLGEASLLVVRGSDELFRLNPTGSRIWSRIDQETRDFEVSELWPTLPEGWISRRSLEGLLEVLVEIGALTGVAGESSSATVGPVAETVLGKSPFLRRVRETWELVEEIEIAPDCLTLSIGEGFAVRSPGRSLSLLTAESAVVWRVLEREGRATFVELLDELERVRDLTPSSAERVLSAVLREWVEEGVVRGLEHVPESRLGRASLNVGCRQLGHLESMETPRLTNPFESLGLTPVVLDLEKPPLHVAVVCQYGIHGIAPGVEPYTQKCIATLRRKRPDLIIVSGGGRHGHGPAREADSVVGWYRDQLPEIPLWLEKFSTTSWENIQYSLEMLASRSLTPQLVSVVCDRARSEKMRLACWLVRRHIRTLPGLRLRVVPLTRMRSTWRDNRLIQAALGVPQVLREVASSRDGMSEEVA